MAQNTIEKVRMLVVEGGMSKAGLASGGVGLYLGGPKAMAAGLGSGAVAGYVFAHEYAVAPSGGAVWPNCASKLSAR